MACNVTEWKTCLECKFSMNNNPTSEPCLDYRKSTGAKLSGNCFEPLTTNKDILNCSKCKFSMNNNPTGKDCDSYRESINHPTKGLLCKKSNNYPYFEPIDKDCKKCKFSSYNNPTGKYCGAYRKSIGAKMNGNCFEPIDKPKEKKDVRYSCTSDGSFCTLDGSFCSKCKFSMNNNPTGEGCFDYRKSIGAKLSGNCFEPIIPLAETITQKPQYRIIKPFKPEDILIFNHDFAVKDYAFKPDYDWLKNRYHDNDINKNGFDNYSQIQERCEYSAYLLKKLIDFGFVGTTSEEKTITTFQDGDRFKIKDIEYVLCPVGTNTKCFIRSDHQGHYGQVFKVNNGCFVTSKEIENEIGEPFKYIRR